MKTASQEEINLINMTISHNDLFDEKPEPKEVVLPMFIGREEYEGRTFVKVDGQWMRK